MAVSRFRCFSVFQTHCLSIPQSLGQASAVLDSHRHWRVAFEPDTPQPPKHKHGDQQADPNPEQLGKERDLCSLH
jgi:hypothetical protein